MEANLILVSKKKLKQTQLSLYLYIYLSNHLKKKVFFA